MSARVLDLTPRLPQPCDCPTHRLAALADRVRQFRADHAQELLLPIGAVLTATDDVLEVLDGIVSAYLPSERTTR